jgi:hypothetical protein
MRKRESLIFYRLRKKGGGGETSPFLGALEKGSSDQEVHVLILERAAFCASGCE